MKARPPACRRPRCVFGRLMFERRVLAFSRDFFSVFQVSLETPFMLVVAKKSRKTESKGVRHGMPFGNTGAYEDVRARRTRTDCGQCCGYACGSRSRLRIARSQRCGKINPAQDGDRHAAPYIGRNRLRRASVASKRPVRYRVADRNSAALS